MYIWGAIDVENQLTEQKEKAVLIEKDISFLQSNICSLPLHISLKISSDVPEKYEDYVRKEILELFQSTKPFYVEIDKIELNKSIVWIKMKENEELKKLHNDLCYIFTKCNVALHEYDSSFIYHSTLFLDSDENKIKEAFERIKSIELPTKLVANKFIIGSSHNGEVGTYKVDSIVEHPF